MLPNRDGLQAGLQVRAVQQDEADQFLSVFCAAFNLDVNAARALFYADPFYDPNLKRVCLLDPTSGAPPVAESRAASPPPARTLPWTNRGAVKPAAPANTGKLPTTAGPIVSCLTIIPSQIRVGGAAVPFGGIAGVATLPTHRRHGYAAALLSETARTMSANHGLAMAALFPSEPDYYSRLGWTYSTSATRWTCRRTHLPRSLDASRIRPVNLASGSDLAGIVRLYEEMTAGRTGACVRGPARWKVITEFLSGRQTVVCDKDGVITGYMQYEQIESAGRLLIHEMHASSDGAVRALLAHVAQQDKYREVQWVTSMEDLARFGVEELPAERALVSDAMLRITDLNRALSLAHSSNYAPVLAELGESLTIIPDDPIIKANRAPILLTPDRAQPASSAHIGLRIAGGIGVLTQLFVGYMAAEDAYAEGLLSASNDRALALADSLFPPRDPFMSSLDHF